MRYSRREAIALGGSGLATVLAGCQSSSSDDAPLNLAIINHTSSPQEIQVRVVDPSEDDASEAEVYSTSDPPRNNDQGTLRIDARSPADPVLKQVDDITEVGRYTVYAQLYEGVIDHWRHFHYVPPENTEESGVIIRIYNDEDTNEPIISFDLN